jgi:hypothetical protein
VPSIRKLTTGDFTRAVGTFLTNRAPLWLVMWWSMLVVPETMEGGPPRGLPGNNFLDGWCRWDGYWYANIATHGYNNITDPWEHADTNFWPMFPLLTRGLMVVLGNFHVAAFVLNHALLVGSIFLFDDIASRVLDAKGRRLAVLLLLLHPFSFYYSALYTESCFLFFSLLTVFFAQRKRWALAGLAAGCAGATRTVGIAASAALVVAYAEHCEWSFKKVKADVLYLAFGGLGTAGYVLYLQLAFHDPLAITKGVRAKDWGADTTWMRFFELIDDGFRLARWPVWPMQVVDLCHLFALASAIILTVLGARKLKPHLTVFSIVALVMLSRMWTNAGRYCAPLFPADLVLAGALVRHPRLTLAVLVLQVMFLAFFMYLYGHGYWVS